VTKRSLAHELGYGGDMAALDAVLLSAGVSRPEKPNISRGKQRAVAELIAEHFVLVCSRGDCQADAVGDDRTPVHAWLPSFCEICGGSRVSAAVRDMQAACKAFDVGRIVIVGGSPMLRTRLALELGEFPQARLVDGTMARTAAQAKDDLAWANVVVIWAGSELLHKATMAYGHGHPQLITTTRRGIPALARAVARYAETHAGPGHSRK
jgi:hypothetical protein